MTTDTASAEGHIADRLGALLDHELGASEEAAARVHLAACADCRRQHDRLAGAVAAAASLGRARAPEGFAARVLKRVRADRRVAGLRPSIEQKVPYEGAIIVLLAACMAVAVLAFAYAHNTGLFAKNDTPAASAPRK